jgi:epsilon-lactone hydrolase
MGRFRARVSGILFLGIWTSVRAACVLALLLTTSVAMADDSPPVDQPDNHGSIRVPAFTLPESTLLGPATRAALERARERNAEALAAYKACPDPGRAQRVDIPEIRRCQAEAFYKTSAYQRLRDRYDVVATPARIAGVNIEVFTPAQGIAQRNRTRVLINLHGGGFLEGAGTNSQLESIPIASVGRIKVISIDYRMAPENQFPAASEDVAAVYRELLKSHRPDAIGIYGCSAGGVLAAESVAWFQTVGLPRPGAVGMFCGAGSYWEEGDSGVLASAIYGYPMGKSEMNAYFKGADPNEASVYPVRSKEALAKFPASLLISSVRDVALSSVVTFHARLVALGVDADLHVWEGLGHAFIYDPDLPESQEAYDVIVKFFDKHLAR